MALSDKSGGERYGQLKLFLLRHGETDWNREGRFQGQNDIPLNERGLSQAQEMAMAAASWNPTALYSSPLRRTMQVAAAISHQVELQVTPEPRLKELDLGKLDGVTGDVMRSKWSTVYDAWRNNPGHVAMPEGESLTHLQNRAWQAILDMERTHSEDDVLLIVSHNFAIRTIITRILGMPWSHFHNMYLSLASVCILESNHRGRRLLGYNNTSHLSPENLS